MSSGVNSEPTVSVVVPFYVGLDELELTLAGLEAQVPGTPPFEVIIAEDGSPTSSRPLSETFDQLRVRVVRIERDGFRLATARNEAICRALPIVLMLDFDCVPMPDHVLSHFEALTSDPGCVTVGLRRFVHPRQMSRKVIESGMRWWDSLEDIESISNPGLVLDKRTGLLERISEVEFPCDLFHGCNVGFGRATAMEAGLFDERFNGAHGYEDIEFAYRVQRNGARFKFVDTPVVHIENRVVNVNARRSGRKRNLALLARLCPDLVDHREGVGRVVS
jgi:glycosyltransferase involved in cell wall biosynthesis